MRSSKGVTRGHQELGEAIETYRSLFNFFPDSLEYGLYLANAQVAENGPTTLLTQLPNSEVFPEKRKKILGST